MTARTRAVIYALLLIAFTAPVSLDPGARTFAPGPDTRLYLWTLGWDLHALKTDPLHIFNANIFFPETQSLAYSEHLIGAALLALPRYASHNTLSNSALSYSIFSKCGASHLSSVL